MSTIEDVLQTSHVYIVHSSKRVIEFLTLTQLMKIKGLKLLKNVKTRWISCHASIQRLISEWWPVMVKMYEDGNWKKGSKKAWVRHLTCIFPLSLCSFKTMFTFLLIRFFLQSFIFVLLLLLSLLVFLSFFLFLFFSSKFFLCFSLVLNFSYSLCCPITP